MKAAVLTVSQVNFFLKSLIEGDGRLSHITVCGEISNFTDHYRSGHLYFSLKDEKSVLKAVMFASAACRLKFRPQDGMKVIVRGRVSVYEPTGQYQMYVEDMQPEGIGALSLAFEQLKERLAAEGLFEREHKKTIPAYPEKIGVITSPTGAAVRDILQITARRWPLAQIVLAPVLVQGSQAPGQIVAAREMDRQRACDVIILGRGGGSMEDLWAFNDESVARAVYACSLPVVSAVGHETDFTICDFVADLRLPRPARQQNSAPRTGVRNWPRCALTTGTSSRKPRAWWSTFAKAWTCWYRIPPGGSLLVFGRPSGRSAGFRAAVGAGFPAPGRRGAEALGRAFRRPGCAEPFEGAFPGLRGSARQDGTLLKQAKTVQPGERVQIRLAEGCLSAEILDRRE